MVFDALLTDGSVTRAARRVGLSQPAFSNALARLRARVGDPLFERSARGMKPTVRALAMADPVSSALAALRQAIAVPSSFEAVDAGRTMTLAANGYAQLVVIPRLIRILRHAASPVRLDVRRADGHPARGGDDRPGLTLDWAASHQRTAPAATVLRDPLVCIVRRTRGERARRLTLARFAELKHVDVASDGQTRDAIQDALARLGVARDIVAAVPDVTMAPAIVAQGNFVASVPRRLAECFAARFKLRMLEPPMALPAAVLHVTWDAPLDSASAWLRDRILEAGRYRRDGP